MTPKFIFACLVLWLWANHVNSQPITLSIKTQTDSYKSILLRYGYQKKFSDSTAMIKALQNLVLKLQTDTFLAASIDTIYIKENNIENKTEQKSDNSPEKYFVAFLHIGKSYQELYLNFDSLPKDLQQIANYKTKFFKQKKYSYQNFLALKTNILKDAENTGYPFAQLYLDSAKLISPTSFEARVRYLQGTYIRFDSIVIAGKKPLQIKKKFLTNYLKLQQNEAFSQKKFNEAEKLLRKLPYLKLLQKPETSFERDRAFLILHTESLKINQFDGIVGLLPNAAQGNQLVFTGQVNLKLYNLFQTGKTFMAEWQSPKPQSQLLNLSYEHPNLFNSRLDVQTNLHLNKRDTSFVNFMWGLQLSYLVGGNAKVFVFTEFRQSTSDSSQINNQDKNIADAKLQLYGLGYEFQNTDNLYAPRTGWHIRTAVAAGNKEIKPQWEKNDDIYKTLQLQSTQIQFTAHLYKYLSLGKKATFLLKNQSGFLLNNNLFVNDLFQIGGIRSLRGFNEMTFFSPYYSINTAEYRLYFEENSSIFAFVDYALLGTRLRQETVFDTPLGIGGGLSFATKAGMFSFVVAMGSSKTQSIGINQTKIHFGLTTRF
jgi:translocation and assembly module TamA